MKKTPVKKKTPKSGSAAPLVKRESREKKKITKSAEPPSFQPDLLKRDLIRQTIITILWRREEATMATLITDLKKEIGHHFDGDLELYANQVKNDLIGWKIMEESPGKRPVCYRLSQKLDKRDDNE
ncbi:MAG: hypothetical protein IPO83_04130 [Chitinophagaceae bacterium]|nr:hypothetical protein [Chitinophagaceae bacterium]